MTDKVALITGANSGISRATAERMGREGLLLVLADKDDPAPVAAAIEAAGGTATPIVTDVREEAEIEAMVAHTRERFGRLDVLVTGAGVNRRANVPDVTVEDFDWIVGVNLRGTLLCCKHAIPLMRESGGGAIVTVGSELAYAGTPNIAVYSASKSGVVQLTRCLAVDHASDGIRVNCVCPGPVDTPLLQGGIDIAPDPAARRRLVEGSTILGRIGRPEEIATVINFLASDEASFMTGAIVLADGGVTAK